MDKTVSRSQTLRDACQRRREAGLALTEQAEAIVLACQAMARRFRQGGALIIFGNGASSPDAQHIAVEFVHPVIVGKRALPALALTNDGATLTGLASSQHWPEAFAHQLRSLARPQDIALGLALDDQCQNVWNGLQAARDMGLLTLALTGRQSGGMTRTAAVDHLLAVAADDPHVLKEAHMTCYHLLWEVVHLCFEHAELLDPGVQCSGRHASRPCQSDALGGVTHPPGHAVAGGIEALYPFLYAPQSHLTTVLQEVQGSTVAKIREITALREQLTTELESRLRTCAGAMAQAFLAQGRLLAFGNGGSATDAHALAQLLLSPPTGRPLPAWALTHDTAVVTALSNDIGFAVVFARQIAALGRAGDMALGFSTSGNSDNVLRAFDEAARRGLLTVGLAGYDGGRMAEAASITHLFVVPSASVHRIQEVQATLYHVLWELIQEALNAVPTPLGRQSAA
jgi:D-sedoheptulose 7-phosphate isomerase